MSDPVSRVGRVDATPSAAAKPADANQSARGSKFSALMYAMLKPPTLDLSEANGDDDDAPRQPMRAHVQPNLAKVMRDLGLDAPATAATPSKADPKKIG